MRHTVKGYWSRKTKYKQPTKLGTKLYWRLGQQVDNIFDPLYFPSIEEKMDLFNDTLSNQFLRQVDWNLYETFRKKK